MSIKDNCLLLSPKRRRKETSGDAHQEDTTGPGERAVEGLVGLGREETVSGQGLGRNLSLSREQLPGSQPGKGLERRRQPAPSSAVGIWAEDHYGVQILSSCPLGK